MAHDPLLYRLALNFIPHVGARTIRSLLEYFGDAPDIFKASLKTLKSVEGVSETRARSIKETSVMHLAEAEMKFMEQQHISCIFYRDANYPMRLQQCMDAPFMLFSKGNVRPDASKVVAIVGTRKCTDYGVQLTEELVEGLSRQKDVLIVSGLALGIDAVAHKQAVKHQVPTIGVLGHGLDRIYPYTHRSLAKEMQELGGLLTEYPHGIEPDREHFPMRNRIVAGMSDVTVVVESDIKGGALITGYIAHSYNREVAAFPGRVHDTRSSGCNNMIRKNVAAMITGSDDLLELMGWQKTEYRKPVQQKLMLSLSEEEQKIVDAMNEKDQLHADELLHCTGLDATALASSLLMLEMQGLIRALPGKYFRRA